MATEHEKCFCDVKNVTSSFCDAFCSGELLYKEAAITLQILYAIVLIVGMGGNLLTCAVIKTRKSMRRSIHIYTFNLAVCDILILMFYVPSQMVYIENKLNWVMGVTICRVNNSILPATLSASVFTLLAITIDRARGLLQPFKWRCDSQRHAKISVPVIWIVSVILCVPMFIYPNVVEENVDGYDLLMCYDIWPDPEDGTKYWLCIFAFLYVIPLLIIFVVHVVMVIVIAKDKNSIHRKKNHKMIKMTVAVVTVFLICTGMQHTYFLWSVYGTFSNSRLQALLFTFSNFVPTVQAALNPIIYGTLRQDFNKSFKGVLMKFMKKLKIHNNFFYRIFDHTQLDFTAVEDERNHDANDFDHYFEERQSKLATTLVTKITDSGFYSIVNDIQQLARVDENENESVQPVMKLYSMPDSPKPPQRFCTISRDVLSRLSYYMTESPETAI